LVDVATTESSMNSKGGVGGKGTPSYKQVVVDTGKGPRSRVFKAPTTRTSGSDPGKHQERSRDKNETMEEVTKETQNEKPGRIRGWKDTTPANPKHH